MGTVGYQARWGAGMNIREYLIEQSGKDWGELLSGWLGVLPAFFTVWLGEPLWRRVCCF